MRNLKRALSLTLASVMLLGMMVVGSSALSFNDADDISNVTAATVLQELGVMIGTEKGNFQPEKPVTRAQMAILICRILYGEKLNDAQFAGVSQYSDVPANYYYTGFINLATQLGIIKGYGNGKFGPDDTVTTAQAALMLCRALGYFQAGELDGQSWGQSALEAIAQATKIYMFGDLELSTHEPLSRDNVCEMVFNTMTKAVPVHYSERWDVYYTDSQSILQGVKFNYRDTLGYQNFDLVYNEDQTDDFQRPATEWGTGTIRGNANSNTGIDDKGNIIKGYATIKNSFIKAPDEPDVVYTAEVKGKDLYNDLALDKTTVASLFVNGKEQDGGLTIRKNDEDTKYGDNGVLIEGYKDDDNNVKLIVIHTYVGKINTVVKATSTAERYVTLRDYSLSPALTSQGNKFETENFDVDDLVSFQIVWDNNRYKIESVSALELTQTGTLTKWVGKAIVSGDKGNSESNFTVDDDTYKYSAHYKIVDEDGAPMSNGIAGFTVKDSEINVYLDDYGYALYVSGVEGEKNYAAVIGTGSTNPYGDKTTGVTLLLPDGTKKTVTAKLATGSQFADDQGTKGGGHGSQLVTDYVGDLVTYTIGDDGIYELTVKDNYFDKDGDGAEASNAGASYVGANAKFLNGKSLLKLGSDNYYTTDKTIFFVCTKDGATDMKYDVYTGYAEMPSFDDTKGIVGFAMAKGSEYSSQIEAIYIAAEELAGVSDVDTYFVKKKNAEITTDKKNGISYYTLPAIVDGEATTVMVKATIGDIDNNATEFGLWAITNVIKNSDGIITSYKKVNVDKNTDGNWNDSVFNATGTTGKDYGVGTVRDRNSVLGIGNTVASAVYWAYNKDTKVYRVDKDYKDIWVDSIGGVYTDVDDLVFASMDDDTKVLKDVIIVEQEPGVNYTVSPSDNVMIASSNSFPGNTATDTDQIFAKGATVYVKAVSGYTIDAEATKAAGLTLTDCTGGVYSFAAQDVAANVIKTVEKVGYDGTVTFDITTPASTTAEWIGTEPPTEEELTSLLIDWLVAAGYDKSTMTISSDPGTDVEVNAKKTINGVAGPQVTFTLAVGDSKQVVTAADQTEFTSALSGSANKIVLSGKAEVTTAPGKDIEVAAGGTLTIKGSSTVNLTNDITGAGNVVIESGDITTNAKIGAANVEIKGGSIDGTPATMTLSVNGNAALKGPNSGKITVVAGKVLTVSGSTALGADIDGAGKVEISGGNVTKGEYIKTTGGIVLPANSVIDKINKIPVSVTGNAKITDKATPESLTQTGGTLTLDGASAELVVPAGTELGNVTVTAGKLTLDGDAEVKESATIAIGTQTIDFANHKLTGNGADATASKITTGSGATISNFTPNSQNFYTNGTDTPVSDATTGMQDKTFTWDATKVSKAGGWDRND